MRYVIADIEATGLGIDREMIELALITYEDGRITDVFETLINPLVPISKFISELTTIQQRELDVAPKFYEIAERVAMRLEGAVFVSHKVSFDWPMLQKAFEAMGRSLKCKTLCTLELSQNMIPGLKSYALEDLCKFFHLQIKERHRALPDAQMALALFKELRELASGKGISKPRYLPQHEAILKKIPRKAGVLYLKDEKGISFHIEAAADLLNLAQTILQVKPENRAILERCETVEFEVTGSELMAQFKKARFFPLNWHWMITLQEIVGEKNLIVKPYVAHLALWVFQNKREAEDALKKILKKMPQNKMLWQEGGKSKKEILEHNRLIDELIRETQFPCDNLLFWGPGPSSGEYSYILVREGKLWGMGIDKRTPEEVLQNPESAVKKKTDKRLELLAIRYLREHRERRIKLESWRELKEVTC
jgi:DNA polymerase III epsilon subunit-like protein